MAAAAAAAAVAHDNSVCVAAFGDHEPSQGDDQVAMEEVAQVYELIKTHQPLLLLHHQPQQLAYSLLTQAMRALNVALSVMKHLPPASVAAVPVNMIKAEETPANGSATPGHDASAADGGDNLHAVGKATRRSSAAKKRRINGEDKPSWFQLTTVVPHEDGYQWRKYGEKKIQGTHFTRSYFRCTYRDDKGCQATKQIQQKDNNDPPNFQVTYSNDHTCNFCTTRIINNSNNPALHNPAVNPDVDTICNKMIKQEPQAAWLPPPPLKAISNDLDETPALHVCQEVPPCSKFYCSDAAAGTCSSNSSVIAHYTDEFDHHQMGQQLLETTVMEEALVLGADLDDPYFNDPQLLFLYENIMNCY
ncbi:hypothetical protein E2562_007639 [Oryza meyeriana var. granulata]|uniref:WRKY domain-containing protein n=1 Tax=Oryza meyeriana var. granulata TaxID=110450 RepID=A0A6G1DWT2_9ORYZ|nr:hypothetical protein E2562_007639 [Oryza meyeriana var. granulata]